jgi:DNA-binding transcriptional LysR family regulator
MQWKHDKMMDLKHLAHLVALADERHFARAAERVHLSQPAFSRSIQALERALGQRLFDRDAGELRPTPAGVFLIERARRLLFDARCLQRDAELYAQSNFGDAALGAGPFPAATLMPRVLPELRRRYPTACHCTNCSGVSSVMRPQALLRKSWIGSRRPSAG